MLDIKTKNVREDEFIPRLRYAMVRLDNLWNTFTKGVMGEFRLLTTTYYYKLTRFSLKSSMSFKL